MAYQTKIAAKHECSIERTSNKFFVAVTLFQNFEMADQINTVNTVFFSWLSHSHFSTE
jgi:hypothetical protein